MSLIVGVNSYVSVADADAYFAERLHSSRWENASPAEKEKALIMATRSLDAAFNFFGVVADESQKLAWPRAYVYDPEGREIPSDKIPEIIAFATCEQALYLLGTDPTSLPDLLIKGFSRTTLGKMSVETDRMNVAAMIAKFAKSLAEKLGVIVPGAGASGGIQNGQTSRA